MKGLFGGITKIAVCALCSYGAWKSFGYGRQEVQYETTGQRHRLSVLYSTEGKPNAQGQTEQTALRQYGMDASTAFYLMAAINAAVAGLAAGSLLTSIAHLGRTQARTNTPQI